MRKPIESLRNVGWLSVLTDSQLQTVAEAASYLARPSNTTVFSQGDIDDALYVILQGRVSVTKTLETGEERFIRDLGPGDYFGELSVLDPAPRSAAILTLEESQFLVLRRPEFLRCLEQNQDLSLAIMVDLVRRVRQADARLDFRQPVGERLRATLASLCPDPPLSDEPQGEFTLHVSRQELANRCHADVKTVSRELTKLELAGAIRRSGRAIFVRLPLLSPALK